MKDWKKEIELREARAAMVYGFVFLCLIIGGSAGAMYAVEITSIPLAIFGLVLLFIGTVGLLGVVETEAERGEDAN